VLGEELGAKGDANGMNQRVYLCRIYSFFPIIMHQKKLFIFTLRDENICKKYGV
jgi:hypothetical protein